MTKQVGHEPRYKRPRIGEKGRYCIFCKRNKGMIRKLKMCRRCFRERAVRLGFKKLG